MGHLMFKQRDYQAAAKWYRMASKLEPQDDDDTLNEILGDPEDYLNRQYLKAMMIYGKSSYLSYFRVIFNSSQFFRLDALRPYAE